MRPGLPSWVGDWPRGVGGHGGGHGGNQNGTSASSMLSATVLAVVHRCSRRTSCLACNVHPVTCRHRQRCLGRVDNRPSPIAHRPSPIALQQNPALSG